MFMNFAILALFFFHYIYLNLFNCIMFFQKKIQTVFTYTFFSYYFFEKVIFVKRNLNIFET